MSICSVEDSVTVLSAMSPVCLLPPAPLSHFLILHPVSLAPTPFFPHAAHLRSPAHTPSRVFPLATVMTARARAGDFRTNQLAACLPCAVGTCNACPCLHCATIPPPPPLPPVCEDGSPAPPRLSRQT